MKKLRKILLLIFVVGASITLLKVFVMNHQREVVHLKKVLCNSKGSDVHTIITVVYSGQLGNNIWEYMSLLAFIRSYQSELNFTAYIPVLLKSKVEYIFERINIPEISRIPKSCLRQKPYVLPLNESFKCDKLLNKNKCPFTLAKYSARYKEIIQYGIDKIKNELRFHNKYIEYSHNILNRIKTALNIAQENVTYVGMHYRGNDYMSFLRNNYNLVNGTPNSTFYLKAMHHFKQKYKTVVFIFITIDLRWLKKNLPLLQENNDYLIVNPNRKDLAKDLILLSQCNHSIINYGTYGTTAALFSGGTTFVYDLGIPLDHRGSTVAMGIAGMLSNWHLLS